MTRFPVFRSLIILFLVVFFVRSNAFSQKIPLSPSQIWVDSVFNSLEPNERIGQLLMVRAYSNRDTAYVNELASLVKELSLGGVCFFQGGPVRQAIVTNRLQSVSRIPLFIAIDGEWGAGMRLDSVAWFPKQLTLGAISNDSLIYEMGAEIARQFKRLGVQINFAPVADINNNPMNPVINARSFGEDRHRVALKAAWYMKGMQDNDIFAVAKHFPGHGDTGSDSHYTLPIIDKSRAEIDSVELFPFRYLIKLGVKGIMVSHLMVPALDTARNSIATISVPIIDELLRNQMGFEGMVITDGMDMKGLTDFADPLLVEPAALKAGNDILLLPVDARLAMTNIQCAIDSGFISQSIIDEKCRRVLRWKFESGLANLEPVAVENLVSELNSPDAALITRKADAGAITLVTDRQGLIPLMSLDSLRIASVVIGDTAMVPFQSMLSGYAPATHFNLPKEPSRAMCDSVMQLLEPYNLVVVGFTKTSDLPRKNFGISVQGVAFADSLSQVKKTILCLFSSPYAMASFKNTGRMAATIVAYQDNAVMQELTAQAIFGGITIGGSLPVAASANYPAGSGLMREKVIRFAFTIPEDEMVAASGLSAIDSIVNDGIRMGAFPGAQVVVARNGKVIYRRAFGMQTYEAYHPLRNDDLYDLASLTKVLATTLTALKLTGDRVIDPDQKLSKYLLSLKKSNKSQLTIREIMAHQAGLQPYIPFYKKMLKGAVQDSAMIGRHFSLAWPVRVADAFYLKAGYPETIIDSIIASPLLKKHEYKYSDLGFVLLAETFSQLTGQPISSYVQRNFYNKLGLGTMGYNPRDRFSISRIAPTENDTIFRHQLVHGDVHDPTAALLGGVSGHAGLFSDALDVAVIMQLFLQNGNYGGEALLDSSTINDFTRVQFPENNNRRGAGFDKPVLIAGQPSPACNQVSSLSFGHSGFTGTYTWVDPVEGLVYVFLSNRVYPDAGNNKITQFNIRTRVHEAIYEAIRKGR